MTPEQHETATQLADSGWAYVGACHGWLIYAHDYSQADGPVEIIGVRPDGSQQSFLPHLESER